MQRLIALSIAISALAGCTLRLNGTPLGNVSGPPTATATSSGAAPPTAAATTPTAKPIQADPGLSEYATRFIGHINDLDKQCADGPVPEAQVLHDCWGGVDQNQNLYTHIDEKSNPQVAQSKAHLDVLAKRVETWRAGVKTAEANKDAKYRADQEVSHATNQATQLIRQLKGARDGKVASILTSFDSRDADYVQRQLESLKKYGWDSLETIGNACAKGGADKELCDIATNREKYWTKMLALQFDAILAEQLKSWTNVIDGITNDDLVAVVNYNKMNTPQNLSAGVGKQLVEIGKVLGQKDTKGAIDAKLAKLHTDFLAAVHAKQNTNGWALYAKDAKYQDPVVTKALRSVDGLSLVRVAANATTWEVIRGAFDQPTQRNKYISALMKKPGESFCRVYEWTVIQDHLGGGRYSEPHLESGNIEQFYISSCK